MIVQDFSDVAAIETEMLTVPGNWCISYGVKLNNVIVYTQYSYTGLQWGYSAIYTWR